MYEPMHIVRAFDPLVPCAIIRDIHTQILPIKGAYMCFSCGIQEGPDALRIWYIPRQCDDRLRVCCSFLLVVVFILISLRFESDILNSTFVVFSLKLPFEIHFFLVVLHDQCNGTTKKCAHDIPR